MVTSRNRVKLGNAGRYGVMVETKYLDHDATLSAKPDHFEDIKSM